MESKNFENAVLSTGWTTKWGPYYTEGSYDNKQIESMINGIKENDVRNAITFPIRAGIAANSVGTLTDLYKSLNITNEITFTVWSSDDDNVNVENLRKLIFHFGLDKVYVDVPKKLLNQLKLNEELHNASCKQDVLILLVLSGLGYYFLIFFLNP